MHLHQKIYEEALTTFLRVKKIRLNGEFISDCALIGKELNEIVAILHHIAKIYKLAKKFKKVLGIGLSVCKVSYSMDNTSYTFRRMH